MMLDIALGAALGVVAFLLVSGVNVWPLLLVAGIAWLIWTFGIKRQGAKGFNMGKRVNKTLLDFDDIGGQNAAKQELKEALDFLLSSERVKALGIRPLKGILLCGPPGTGKTLLAKAAARYTSSAFLAVSGSEFVEMYAGVGAERVRSLFRRSRDLAKKEKKNSAIIFIDELDILGGKRGTNMSHHEYDQTLNQLLVEMDGLVAGDGPNILVIGATNRDDILDPALLRPGRFDRLVHVDLPDKGGRLAILQIHAHQKPLADDVDLGIIAQETFGFSGAHLESLTNEAAVFALREHSQRITQQHLSEAIDKVMLGEKLECKPSQEEMWRVSVHESGHALLAETVNPQSVAQISVRSRGNALGYVRHYPEDDIHLYTQKMLEDQIMISLSGAVAEELILDTRSTGAAGDYQQALHLVEKMLVSGMSPLGVVDVERLDPEQRYDVTRRILSRLEERTKEVLNRNQERLMRIARMLEQEEVLSGEELRVNLENLG